MPSATDNQVNKEEVVVVEIEPPAEVYHETVGSAVTFLLKRIRYIVTLLERLGRLWVVLELICLEALGYMDLALFHDITGCYGKLGFRLIIPDGTLIFGSIAEQVMELENLSASIIVSEYQANFTPITLISAT
ncbi:hypothetical protein L2E82_47690 [Cichorium intybus]|uniref:Uncharacterized protein n=1 Tax=Cichorium intybus TaxID=13427 RepID=A0ACB8YXP1_CICIN|nr:hypothetical protein L2E82_47690 [Cichorium intybus]